MFKDKCFNNFEFILIKDNRFAFTSRWELNNIFILRVMKNTYCKSLSFMDVEKIIDKIYDSSILTEKY